MKRLILLLLVFTVISDARESEEKEEEAGQVKRGNLLLNGSQQPSPLFSVGQNIVDEGDLIAYIYLDYLKNKNSKFNTIIPYILYGITDRFSVYIDIVPFATRFQSGCNQSEGIIDFHTQFEYAVYNHAAKTYTNMITLIGTIGLPTGSAFKMPRTGFGSTSFLLGTTASHLDTIWYYFLSAESILTTKLRDGTKLGNVFLYQGGLGRNIGTPGGNIFNWLIEFNGVYDQRDTIKGTVDPNSGSHTLFVGPSLWLSTPRTTIQIGIEFPVFQRLFGNQTGKTNFYFGIQLEWKVDAPRPEKH